MDEIFADNPDVEWTCTLFEGIPILVLQAVGPVMSASLLARPVPEVNVRYVYDPDEQIPNASGMFVCYTDRIDQPILAANADKITGPVIAKIVQEAEPWLLSFQVTVEGQKSSRMFMVNGKDVHERIVNRWIVEMV